VEREKRVLKAFISCVQEGTQCRTNEEGDETFYAPYQRPLIANQTQGFLRYTTIP
jgi:hypothetical protein